MARPATTSGRPKRPTSRPPTAAANPEPRAKGVMASPASRAEIAEAGLEVEGGDEEDRGEPGEVEQDQQAAQPVGAQPEQRQVQDRLDASARAPRLPGDEGGEQGGGEDEQQPFRVAGPLLGLDERQQQGQYPGAQEQHAERVQVTGADPGGGGGVGQQPVGEQEADDAERQVDVEDPAPAVFRSGGLDEQPAEQRADGRGDADDGAEHAEGPAALAPGEHLLDEGGDLRGDQTARDALHQTGDHQPQAGLGRPAGGGGQGEEGESGHEDRPAAPGVAEASGRDEEKAEGEGVTGEHPLEIGLGSVEALPDGGEGDVDDGDVQQGHEARDQADGECLPTPGVGAVRGGVAPGRPGCAALRAMVRTLGGVRPFRADRRAAWPRPPGVSVPA